MQRQPSSTAGGYSKAGTFVGDKRVSSVAGSLISPNTLEDNMFGDGVGGDEEMIEEDEEVEQLSVEQLKSKLRY